MTTYKLLTGFALAIIALVLTLMFTKYDYGHNIWNRLCNKSGNAPVNASAAPVCKEVTTKDEDNYSPALREQDYFYLAVQLPITHYAYEYHSPRFDFPSPIFSTTLSYAKYALSHPRFYVDYLVVLIIVFLGYYLLDKTILKKSFSDHRS